MHRRQNHLVDDILRVGDSAAKSMSGRPCGQIHFFPIPTTTGTTTAPRRSSCRPRPRPHYSKISLFCFYDCSDHPLRRCPYNGICPADARPGDARSQDDDPRGCDWMRKMRKMRRTTGGKSPSPPYIDIFPAAKAHADASSAAGHPPGSEKTKSSPVMNPNADTPFLSCWNRWNEAASRGVLPPGRDTCFPSN
jgi:hypothetical protein